MDTLVLDDVLAQLRAARWCDDLPRAVAIVDALRGAAQLEVFTELDDETQVGLLPELNTADSAHILDKEESAELVAAAEQGTA